MRAVIKNMREIKNITKYIIITLVLFMLPNFVMAAENPACNPHIVGPDACNVEPPINVSDSPQIKEGDFRLLLDLYINGILISSSQAIFTGNVWANVLEVDGNSNICLVGEVTGSSSEIDPQYTQWHNSGYPFLHRLYLDGTDTGITKAAAKNYMDSEQIGLYSNAENTGGVFTLQDNNSDRAYINILAGSEYYGFAGLGQSLGGYHVSDGVAGYILTDDSESPALVAQKELGTPSEISDGEVAYFQGLTRLIGEQEIYGNFDVMPFEFDGGGMDFEIGGDTYLKNYTEFNIDDVSGSSTKIDGTLEVLNERAEFEQTLNSDGGISVSGYTYVHDDAGIITGDVEPNYRQAIFAGNIEINRDLLLPQGGQIKAYNSEVRANAFTASGNCPLGLDISKGLEARRFIVGNDLIGSINDPTGYVSSTNGGYLYVGGNLVFTSPNGEEWSVTIDDSGTINTYLCNGAAFCQ